MKQPSIRQWRLYSGLVMFVYIAMHMINHALGLWSLALAEAGLTLAMFVWQSPPGMVALYGAAAIHFALALRTLYERRHWRLPLIEWVRLWAGFSLPWLLIGHVVATRLASGWYDFTPSYENVVGTLVRGGLQGWQIALLAPGWIHGCLGLWLSLRRYLAVRRMKTALVAVMLAMPVLSAFGFANMARTSIQAPTDKAVLAVLAPEHRQSLEGWRQGMVALYLLLLAGAAGAGLLRNWRAGRTRGRPARPDASPTGE